MVGEGSNGFDHSNAQGLSSRPPPAAAILVTKTADTDGTCNSGVDCSVREAIKLANAQSGDDTITFAPGLTGTINLRRTAACFDDEPEDPRPRRESTDGAAERRAATTASSRSPT